jgi:hypothetical protein
MTPSTRSHQWEPETLETLNRWARGTPKERQAANEIVRRHLDRQRLAALRARASTPPEGHNGE